MVEAGDFVGGHRHMLLSLQCMVVATVLLLLLLRVQTGLWTVHCMVVAMAGCRYIGACSCCCPLGGWLLTASCEMCTRPLVLAPKSTKAPKVSTDTCRQGGTGVQGGACPWTGSGWLVARQPLLGYSPQSPGTPGQAAGC
jgi:hypothetical protein